MKCEGRLPGDEDSDSIIDNLTFVQGVKEHSSRDTYIECPNLKQGVYYLFVQMDWFTSPNPHFRQSQFIAVNCYGKGWTSIESDFSEDYGKIEVLE